MRGASLCITCVGYSQAPRGRAGGYAFVSTAPDRQRYSSRQRGRSALKAGRAVIHRVRRAAVVYTRSGRTKKNYYWLAEARVMRFRTAFREPLFASVAPSESDAIFIFPCHSQCSASDGCRLSTGPMCLCPHLHTRPRHLSGFCGTQRPCAALVAARRGPRSAIPHRDGRRTDAGRSAHAEHIAPWRSGISAYK